MKPLLTLLLAAAATTTTLAAQTPANPFLVHSTLFGSAGVDSAAAVATDADGSTYVTGLTNSTDMNAVSLPGTRAEASNHAYITKFDPTGKKVVWSYLVSGNSNTSPAAIALDPHGDVWITGTTGSSNFLLVNPVQTKKTGLNIPFLLKLSPDGKVLFSTILGGERNDNTNSMAIDHAGNVYIGGTTNSAQFPVLNALRSKYVGGEGFIAKFSNDGALLYATYFGGSGNDEIAALAVGPDDSLFVTGYSNSQDLPVKGGWIEKYQGYPSYVAKVNPAGDQILWATYIAAPSAEVYTKAMAIDADGSPVIVGCTSGKNLPTTSNALQPKYSGGLKDAFLLKLTPEGNRATYFSYIGGSFTGKADPDDNAAAVSIDTHGYVYVAGHSAASDLATARARQNDFGGGTSDSWVMRFDLQNSRLVSSTYWGGDKADQFNGLALGPGENYTVVGQTVSSNFPLEQPIQTTVRSTSESTITRFCDPWLSASTSQVTFTYTLGQGTPDAQEFEITDGCTVAHNATSISTNAPWLNVTPDQAAMPGAKVKITPIVDGLAAGEYRTTVRVVVPEAISGPMDVTVVLQVVEPPPPPVENQ